MPYPTNASLPPAVKDKIKSPKRRRQWRHVWTSEYQEHGDEGRAFASAWSAVRKSAKVSKEDAQYIKSSALSDHCAICTMFRNPGSCTTVKGEISPSGWCKFFEEKVLKYVFAHPSTSFSAAPARFAPSFFPPWLRFS